VCDTAVETAAGGLPRDGGLLCGSASLHILWWEAEQAQRVSDELTFGSSCLANAGWDSHKRRNTQNEKTVESTEGISDFLNVA